ncbi:MAG: 6-phosphofructokinase, partial [Oscillospiraceae bacterium]|nr:6-phosphofructokinase [Oscillospiraceae bacterium]
MLIGNAVIGQSGGPTAAINATLAGVIKGAYSADCINNVYGMFNGIEGFLEERICKLENIDIELLSQTPSSALGSCRMKLPKD